jgi:hypothetical protein
MAFLGVPIATVKSALKIDTDDDDATLAIYTSAATRAVFRYLKTPYGDFSPAGDSPADSPPNSPPDDLTAIDERTQFAVIALTGILYREPDGDAAKNFAAYGELPYVVTALLYSERIPTLA